VHPWFIQKILLVIVLVILLEWRDKECMQNFGEGAVKHFVKYYFKDRRKCGDKLRWILGK
jgi:hypothetical protein